MNGDTSQRSNELHKNQKLCKVEFAELFCVITTEHLSKYVLVFILQLSSLIYFFEVIRLKFRVVFLREKTLVIVLLVLFVLFSVAEVVVKNNTAVSVFASPLTDKVVLIDPGHGGVDAGASANGATEKTLNLEVAKLLQQFIETGGGTAYLTRADDSDTADPNRQKGLSQKLSDLKERKAEIEKDSADVFVSVHMNKFEQEKYRGAQVFFDPTTEENKLLADEIQNAIREAVNDDNTRQPKDTGNNIYVLKNNSVPSVLVECGFLSNPEEAKLLTSSQYQRKVAWGIYVGLVRYFSR